MFIPYFLLVLVPTVTAQQQEGDSCVDQYTSAAGICKPVDQCQTAKQDLQESGIKPTFCTHIPVGDALVCCRDGLTILETPTLRRRTEDLPTLGTATQRDTKRVSERKCDEYSRGVVQKVDYLLLFVKPETFSITVDKCSGPTASLYGELAKPGEFPHMVAIGSKNLTNNNFVCGGSLISPRFVLTVAHCSTVSENDIVRLGDQNLDDSVNDGVTPIDIPILRSHKHPDYKPPKRYNDIALVELARDVVFNYNIRPACLWTKPNFPGYNKVIATGWNLININSTSQEKALKKVSINLFENNFCETLHSNFKNRLWAGYNDSQMCAGEIKEKWDSCLNESGSPLQVASKENECVFYILGITSFGVRCTYYEVPSIYTRVSAFLDWIEEVVWPGE